VKRPCLFGCYVALTREERLMHYDEQREKELEEQRKKDSEK